MVNFNPSFFSVSASRWSPYCENTVETPNTSSTDIFYMFISAVFIMTCEEEYYNGTDDLGTLIDILYIVFKKLFDLTNNYVLNYYR